MDYDVVQRSEGFILVLHAGLQPRLSAFTGYWWVFQRTSLPSLARARRNRPQPQLNGGQHARDVQRAEDLTGTLLFSPPDSPAP